MNIGNYQQISGWSFRLYMLGAASFIISWKFFIEKGKTLHYFAQYK